MIRYAIFPTEWGYFGLAVCPEGLLRTHLPCGQYRRLERGLLRGLGPARFQPNLCEGLQRQIKAYFRGVKADPEPDLPLALDGFGEFTRSVLAACRRVEYGATAGYKELAAACGRPGAARAAAGALAANPLPLVVPCHRVVRSDGAVGGFSAEGGAALKRRMLELEEGGLGRKAESAK
jgi:O-6-methylguanine DNA methyltransferase